MTSEPVVQRRLGRALLLLVCGLTTLATAFVVPVAQSSVSSAAGSVSTTSATARTASFFASMGASARRRRPRLAPLRVVWSNPQETEDYFRRIEGKEEKDKVGGSG